MPVDPGRIEDYRTYSRFGRDPEAFLYVVDRILYGLARDAANSGTNVVRVWSVGCAGGEEPYSLAIAWHAALAERFPSVRLEIVATDVDGASLERARNGVFDGHAVTNLPVEWVSRCFDAREGSPPTYELREEIRSRVAFARADAARDDPPPGPFCLVSSRYSLFLYLSQAAAAKALAAVCAPGVLRRGGYLVTGLSDKLPRNGESLGLVKRGAGAPDGIYRCAAALPAGLPPRAARDDGLPPSLTELLDCEAREQLKPAHLRRGPKRSFVNDRSRAILEAAAQRLDDAPARDDAPDAARRAPVVADLSASIYGSARPRFEALPAPPKPLRPLPAETRAALDRLARPVVRAEPLPETPAPRRRALAPEEARALVERMMHDIVKREQSLAALRRDLADPATKGRKLGEKALADFIARMRGDTDARKRHLADLQEQILRDEAARPGDDRVAAPDVSALRALGRIAAAPRRPPTLAVAPSKLVRFLLKRPAMPPAPLFDRDVFEDARPRATLARAPAATCKHPDAATIFRRPLPMGGGRLGF